MERFCGVVKLKARSKSQLNASLANAVVITEHLNHLQFTRAAISESLPVAVSYPVLLNWFKPYLSTYQRSCLKAILKCYNFVVKGYKKYQLRQDLLVGSMQSQRRSDVNRRDNRICYQEPGKRQRGFGEILYFARLGQFGDWAWIRTLDGVKVDRIKEIVNFQRLGSHRWMPVEWIQSLIGII